MVGLRGVWARASGRRSAEGGRPKEETAKAGGISRPRQRNPILVFGRLTGLFMNGSRMVDTVQYVFIYMMLY